MWLSKKVMDELKNRIAALEEEQQQIRKFVKESIESNEELIGIVKQIYNNLAGSETVNANGLKLLS